MKKIILLISISLGLSNLYGQSSTKDATITALRNEVISLINVNEELRNEINRMKAILAAKEEALNEVNTKTTNRSIGEEYRIQLGVQNTAIESLSSPKFLEGSIVNGRMVYAIGGFQNPQEAYALSLEMRKLNLSGAFVTRYFNGERDYSYKYGSSNNASYKINNNANSRTVTNFPAKYYSQPTRYKVTLPNQAEPETISNPNAKKSTTLVIE